jgi:hypothetical protein
LEDEKEDRQINAAKVAQIWNERARKSGVESNYTRWSVRGRREELSGERTDLGWLYSEKRAWTIPLRPRTTKRPDMSERNRQWNRERKEEQQREAGLDPAA